LNEWHHVVVTYDGSRFAEGVKVYIDGAPTKTIALLDELNQTFATKEPLRIGHAGSKDNQFDGLIDDLRIYSRAIGPPEARVLSVPATVREIVAKPAANRSASEAEKLQAYFYEEAAPKEIRNAYHAHRLAGEAWQKYEESIPTVMVMEEMPTPRDSFVLQRGQYDRRGEKVIAGVPESLVTTKRAANRLDFAKWLVSPDNTLTARVAVNRIWQLHFGKGLVRTSEDFGTQGDFPSHPELLDWLATEFVRTGWDMKRMHKLIVTSAVYRQSSVTRSQAADAENRLLSRFARNRLSTEMIRDQALFASGLLVEHQAGPSVKSYQPPGLWDELSGTGDYTPDHGDKLYRRSLYTFWKRTVAPPTLAAFDAAGRELCWVRETRTNTPIQALTLLNDVTFVEAARKLAERVMREAKSADERLMLAFRIVVSRQPSDTESSVLRRGLDRQLTEYRKNPAAAKKLLKVGQSATDSKLDEAELAAYTEMCRLILNLDEAITRE
jgi:hypothetical protein